MTVGELLTLAAIALAVGVAIGAVGVGGILLVPSMVWLGGVSIHEATATALFTFFFIGIVGTWLFQRRGSIDWSITRPLLAGAVVFGYLGARVNALIESKLLTLIIALIIVLAGAYVLLPMRRDQTCYRNGRSRGQQLLLLSTGALAGFGSGLTGAGGPLFSIPLLFVLGFAPLTAIGASQALQIVASLSGTLGNLQFGSISFLLAAWITLFELAGAVLGARVAHAASVAVLRRSAAGACVLTGVIMLARVLYSKEIA